MAATNILSYLGDNPSINVKAEGGKRKREREDIDDVPKKMKRRVRPRSKTVISLGSDDDDVARLPAATRMQGEVCRWILIHEILTILEPTFSACHTSG